MGLSCFTTEGPGEAREGRVLLLLRLLLRLGAWTGRNCGWLKPGAGLAQWLNTQSRQGHELLKPAGMAVPGMALEATLVCRWYGLIDWSTDARWCLLPCTTHLLLCRCWARASCPASPWWCAPSL